MTISIKSRKAKARKLQNYVRDMIIAHFPPLNDLDVRPAIMGEKGIDIHLSQRARDVFNYDVECKNDNNKSVWSAWAQAKANTKLGKTMLFMMKDYHIPLAVIEATDLFYLLEKLHNIENKWPKEVK